MSDLRERVIAAIKAKGPHAKASTIADAVMPLCMEEAARCADAAEKQANEDARYWEVDAGLRCQDLAAAIRALANPASGS